MDLNLRLVSPWLGWEQTQRVAQIERLAFPEGPWKHQRVNCSGNVMWVIAQTSYMDASIVGFMHFVRSGNGDTMNLTCLCVDPLYANSLIAERMLRFAYQNLNMSIEE